MTRPRLAVTLRATAVLLSALLLAACTPSSTDEPAASPSSASPGEASPGASPDASASGESAITLPDCASIYSPAMVATLESENRESLGDVSADGPGGWGTADASIEAILAALPERVSCTWILPASESGSTTSIAVIDDAARTALVASFAAAGFAVSTVSSVSSGDLYSISVEEEFGTYTETHVLTEEVWVASVYFGGDATALTLDAAASVLP